jgi:hypothetical protein
VTKVIDLRFILDLFVDWPVQLAIMNRRSIKSTWSTRQLEPGSAASVIVDPGKAVKV